MPEDSLWKTSQITGDSIIEMPCATCLLTVKKQAARVAQLLERVGLLFEYVGCLFSSGQRALGVLRVRVGIELCGSRDIGNPAPGDMGKLVGISHPRYGAVGRADSPDQTSGSIHGVV